jgi:hypothetical protein
MDKLSTPAFIALILITLVVASRILYLMTKKPKAEQILEAHDPITKITDDLSTAYNALASAQLRLAVIEHDHKEYARELLKTLMDDSARLYWSFIPSKNPIIITDPESLDNTVEECPTYIRNSRDTLRDLTNREYC